MENQPALYPKVRLERIGEIFYSVAFLIMVATFFDIPEELSSKESWDAFLLQQVDYYSGFVISFIIVGMYWLTHQEYFNYFVGTNKTHTFLELLALMAIISVPFGNYLYNEFPDQVDPRLLISLDMVLVGVLQFVSWSYGSKNNRLLGDNPPDAAAIKAMKVEMLQLPFFAILGALASYFINVYLWEAILIGGPVLAGLLAKKKK